MDQDGPFTTHDVTSHDKPTMSMKRPSLICYDAILSLNFRGGCLYMYTPVFLHTAFGVFLWLSL